MAKFTDTQLIVLSSSAADKDGIAPLPNNLNSSAAKKVNASLVKRGLMEEIPAKPGITVWRRDEDGNSISLRITSAGCAAIGVEEVSKPDSVLLTATTVPDAVMAASEFYSIQLKPVGSLSGSASRPPRPGSKQALVIEMLTTETGSTLEALAQATGWLPHTTRAALTGLRKRRYALDRVQGSDQKSVYRIVTAGQVQAGA